MELFSVINRKWSMLVLASIRASGKVGYKGIENGLKGISPKSLTDTLSLLMLNGLITKKKLGGIPPRVEYSLTPLGTELVELFEPIIIWAQSVTDHAECPILEFLSIKS
ncbi:MAG: helix-turn-helix domain-containing protein [Thermoplasmatales archaeon]|nr:MAG: helix-turn-helix domain-containing protein [Thermoplasmatales archaeon]